MLQIAGGIILAVLVLAFLPQILTLAFAGAIGVAAGALAFFIGVDLQIGEDWAVIIAVGVFLFVTGWVYNQIMKNPYN